MEEVCSFTREIQVYLICDYPNCSCGYAKVNMWAQERYIVRVSMLVWVRYLSVASRGRAVHV